MVRFGKALRRRRVAAGVSQAAVAKALGLKQQSSWSRVETGKSAVNMVQLAKFARLLGVSMVDIGQDLDDSWRLEKPG